MDRAARRVGGYRSRQLEAHPADHVLQFATRGLAEDQDDELIAPKRPTTS
jgi:hypothetical protein